jgi:hypothetical protein
MLGAVAPVRFTERAVEHLQDGALGRNDGLRRL